MHKTGRARISWPPELRRNTEYDVRSKSGVAYCLFPGMWPLTSWIPAHLGLGRYLCRLAGMSDLLARDLLALRTRGESSCVGTRKIIQGMNLLPAGRSSRLSFSAQSPDTGAWRSFGTQSLRVCVCVRVCWARAPASEVRASQLELAAAEGRKMKTREGCGTRGFVRRT